MRHGDVVFGGDLAAHAVDDSCGDGEVSGSLCAGAGEVCFGEVLEEGDDGRGFAVGEEEPDVADEMGREEGGVGLVFRGGIAAEGFGHYFCLAEEESGGWRRRGVSTYLVFLLWVVVG